MSELLQYDQELFLWLNGRHTLFFDALMAVVSGRATWIPLYLTMIAWLFYKQQKQAWWSVGALVLAVAIADRLTSGLIKPLAGRLRPCHEPGLSELVYIVDGCGGAYGFVSSHAANSFALAVLFGLLYRRRLIIPLLLAWAALVSYSRIYLGVHYPADVLAGALAGAATGGLVFYCGVKMKLLQHI